MSGSIVEVKNQITEILYRLAPCKRIYAGPHQERNKDPDASATEKLSCRVVERELQIAGCHNEKRYARADKRVEES
jgi:hypothetical protein